MQYRTDKIDRPPDTCHEMLILCCIIIGHYIIVTFKLISHGYPKETYPLQKLQLIKYSVKKSKCLFLSQGMGGTKLHRLVARNMEIEEGVYSRTLNLRRVFGWSSDKSCNWAKT